MPIAPGTKLGPYEILSPLGSGGMGEVYRARDTRLDRTVAVKILPAHLSSDPARKQRFEREAKIISGLNHPNICTLHDVGSLDGLDYLVMECVEGDSLAQRLEKGPVPADQVLKIGAEIADALDKAHRSGVVHRDLKPANIMLTKSGAKLLDFGLAKPTAPQATLATLTTAFPQQSPVTQEGTIVGTFQYMSPEQIEGKELDGRSDVFSLGTVLYEMLTGKRAFDGKSQLSVASAILEKEPAPISTVNPLTPISLDHAIRRCLAKDPDDRWQTARDLALELRWLTTPSAVTGGDARRPVVPESPKNKFRKYIPYIIEALALIAVAYLFGRPARTATARGHPPRQYSFLPKNLSLLPSKPMKAAFPPFLRTAATWFRRCTTPTARCVSGSARCNPPRAKSSPARKVPATPSGLPTVAPSRFFPPANSNAPILMAPLFTTLPTRLSVAAAPGTPTASSSSPRPKASPSQKSPPAAALPWRSPSSISPTASAAIAGRSSFPTANTSCSSYVPKNPMELAYTSLRSTIHNRILSSTPFSTLHT